MQRESGASSCPINLPSFLWPIDSDFLERAEWLTPDEEVLNWCQETVAVPNAAETILAGLRFGRVCPDPWELRWTAGASATGSGPDRDVTAADALTGVVQTLRNAR